jgi:hypothetical protein
MADLSEYMGQNIEARLNIHGNRALALLKSNNEPEHQPHRLSEPD